MAEPRRGHVLIVGVTTRAMAMSAARAGYRVTAVDPFGDADLQAVAKVITPSAGDTGFHPISAVSAGASVRASFAAYTSNLENYPRAVEELARGRTLLGNSPEVLTRVRDPAVLLPLLEQHGFAVPRIRGRAPRDHRINWILKPRRSGGGHGVVTWIRGQTVPRDSYLQERIAGVPGSVIFAANGTKATVLGLSRQIVGDSRFGARGFRYCGSLLGSSRAPVFSRHSDLHTSMGRIAQVVTGEFGLVGLNGIDFIAHNGTPYPLEVNPRYSASMELLERATGSSMFDIHARACQGELPPEPSPITKIEGKAVVFARCNFIIGDTERWSQRGEIADVPRSGTAFRKGHPICTIFGRAFDPTTCLDKLVRQATAVYRHTKIGTGRAA